MPRLSALQDLNQTSFVHVERCLRNGSASSTRPSCRIVKCGIDGISADFGFVRTVFVSGAAQHGPGKPRKSKPCHVDDSYGTRHSARAST